MYDAITAMSILLIYTIFYSLLSKFMHGYCRLLQYIWMEDRYTLRSEDQALAVQLEEEVMPIFFLPQFTLSNVMRVLPVSPKALKVLIASCYFHCLSDHVGLTCVH